MEIVARKLHLLGDPANGFATRSRHWRHACSRWAHNPNTTVRTLELPSPGSPLWQEHEEVETLDRAIGQLLERNNFIEDLHLCEIDGRGIAAGLSVNRSLKSLHLFLQGTPAQDGSLLLLEGLLENSSLRELNLDNISASIAASLRKYLRQNGALQKLTLRFRNPGDHELVSVITGITVVCCHAHTRLLELAIMGYSCPVLLPCEFLPLILSLRSIKMRQVGLSTVEFDALAMGLRENRTLVDNDLTSTDDSNDATDHSNCLMLQRIVSFFGKRNRCQYLAESSGTVPLELWVHVMHGSLLSSNIGHSLSFYILSTHLAASISPAQAGVTMSD